MKLYMVLPIAFPLWKHGSRIKVINMISVLRDDAKDLPLSVTAPDDPAIHLDYYYHLSWLRPVKIGMAWSCNTTREPCCSPGRPSRGFIFPGTPVQSATFEFLHYQHVSGFFNKRNRAQSLNLLNSAIDDKSQPLGSG